MAKRFFDTRLHKKKWFRDSPLHIQAAYIFLLSECDVAGVWDLDLEILSIYAKVPVTLEELFKYLNTDKDRISLIDSDSKLWLKDFVTFQYGQLSPNSPPHKPVVKRLQELNLPLPLRLPLQGFPNTPQEEEEYKDKLKEEGKEKAKVKLQKLIDLFKSVFPEASS